MNDLLAHLKMTSPVILVTGSYPPEVCGVGDYVQKLSESLEAKRHRVKIFHKSGWSIRYLVRYLKEIKENCPQIIHFQYPTEGYGYSFLPMLLMLFLPGERIIITIHEYSSRTFKARVFTFFMILMARVVIVTNEEEKIFIKQNFLLRRKDIEVINIGSNILASTESDKPFMNRQVDIAYFGHIRPIKGLEGFLDCIEKIRMAAGASINVCIIGQTIPKYQSYFEGIKMRAEKLGISFILNGSQNDTAVNLSNCKIVYLPFIDGVSARRGSLAAAAMNGCVVISTFSRSGLVNDFFEKYCYLVRDNNEAVILTRTLLNGDSLPRRASELATFFSWGSIADRHIEIYDKLLN